MNGLHIVSLPMASVIDEACAAHSFFLIASLMAMSKAFQSHCPLKYCWVKQYLNNQSINEAMKQNKTNKTNGNLKMEVHPSMHAVDSSRTRVTGAIAWLKSA